jgi:hypothetical protein
MEETMTTGAGSIELASKILEGTATIFILVAVITILMGSGMLSRYAITVLSYRSGGLYYVLLISSFLLALSGGLLLGIIFGFFASGLPNFPHFHLFN